MGSTWPMPRTVSGTVWRTTAPVITGTGGGPPRALSPAPQAASSSTPAKAAPSAFRGTPQRRRVGGIDCRVARVLRSCMSSLLLGDDGERVGLGQGARIVRQARHGDEPVGAGLDL